MVSGTAAAITVFWGFCVWKAYLPGEQLPILPDVQLIREALMAGISEDLPDISQHLPAAHPWCASQAVWDKTVKGRTDKKAAAKESAVQETAAKDRIVDEATAQERMVAQWAAAQNATDASAEKSAADRTAIQNEAVELAAVIAAHAPLAPTASAVPRSASAWAWCGAASLVDAVLLLVLLRWRHLRKHPAAVRVEPLEASCGCAAGAVDALAVPGPWRRQVVSPTPLAGGLSVLPAPLEPPPPPAGCPIALPAPRSPFPPPAAAPSTSATSASGPTALSEANLVGAWRPPPACRAEAMLAASPKAKPLNPLAASFTPFSPAARSPSASPPKALVEQLRREALQERLQDRVSRSLSHSPARPEGADIWDGSGACIRDGSPPRRHLSRSPAPSPERVLEAACAAVTEGKQRREQQANLGEGNSCAEAGGSPPLRDLSRSPAPSSERLLEAACAAVAEGQQRRKQQAASIGEEAPAPLSRRLVFEDVEEEGSQRAAAAPPEAEPSPSSPPPRSARPSPAASLADSPPTPARPSGSPREMQQAFQRKLSFHLPSVVAQLSRRPAFVDASEEEGAQRAADAPPAAEPSLADSPLTSARPSVKNTFINIPEGEAEMAQRPLRRTQSLPTLDPAGGGNDADAPGHSALAAPPAAPPPTPARPSPAASPARAAAKKSRASPARPGPKQKVWTPKRPPATSVEVPQASRPPASEVAGLVAAPGRSPGRDVDWRAKGLEEEYARLVSLTPKALPAPQVDGAGAPSPCAACYEAASGAKAEAEATGTAPRRRRAHGAGA
ncbi:unnamed protein product [Prorocentrum cordatum]|uniref:Uncharacterized protein n=1 Tax=Prorocentrum cordatum TaxID=2364126 RepID=A0ABN9P615_9DINO|nr:unnamed protein product [Polarella glacialis]